MNDVTPGIYHHFKGNQYEVLGTVTHSETNEELVLYRPLANPDRLFVRPKAMFGELVEVEGEMVPRFRLTT